MITTCELHTQKVSQKAGPKKSAKKAAKKEEERHHKSLFLNLSCCCLETGLKPVLFFNDEISFIALTPGK